MEKPIPGCFRDDYWRRGHNPFFRYGLSQISITYFARMER